MSKRIRPFSNGAQYSDWEVSNCCRCKKAATMEQVDSGEDLPCEIENALARACVSDGTINFEIAQRMNYTPDKYVWECGEAEWTEEWKEEYRRKYG